MFARVRYQGERMRAVVRLEALTTLRATIEAAVPELRDHVEIVQVPPDQPLTFPSLAIVGTKYRYVPFQEDAARDADDEEIRPDPTSLVVNLGCWETTVQLRLATTTIAERFALQETLTEMFMQREGAPGILCTTVTACPALGNILASWVINDGDWEDDKAFSSQHWATLDIDGTIPVLVTRRGVYTLDDLRLGITRDFAIPRTSAGFDALPVVTINEDGSITRI